MAAQTESYSALTMDGVSKRFPGTQAVDNVDFEVGVGEVHALMGENGAGKSTLMKTLTGSFDDYTGTIRIGGKEVPIHSPAAADAIDLFFFGNDLGTQHGPMVSEPLFRRFVQPHLQRLARLGHDYDLKVMMHCCGGFAELMPMFIDAGIDGIHTLQPSCRGMDLRALKTQFGGKMVLNGAIDSHHVLIEGTPESVRQATRDVLAIMKPNGGYIAGASHDTILEETPVENVVAMFEAIREFGGYGQ